MRTEWTMLMGLVSLLPALGCGGGANNASGAGGSGGPGGQGGSAVSSGSGGSAVSSGSSASGGSGGGMVVDPPACVDPATLPSWRQGMAIGEWKALPSADLTAVTPDVQPGGGFTRGLMVDIGDRGDLRAGDAGRQVGGVDLPDPPRPDHAKADIVVVQHKVLLCEIASKSMFALTDQRPMLAR